jgi:hypothetical protein
MKDKFGHLRDEGEEKTKDQELRGGEPRRENQYSERYEEDQREVRENINEANGENRERQLRRDTDLEDNKLKSSIRNVDYAITYEFDENFDFHVKQNGRKIKVPVIWDNQERWTWARKRRELKSVKDKVLLPLIVIDRNDVSDHPSHITMPTITQVNHRGRTQSVRQRYSKKNRYDNFAVLQDAQPEREYYMTQIPDFMQVSYDVTIYTEYRWQMDKMTDLIRYYNYSYWGNADEGRIFYTQVDSMNTEVEMSEEARFVQNDLSLTVDGYVVPDELQDGEPGTEKATSPSKLEFSENVVTR